MWLLKKPEIALITFLGLKIKTHPPLLPKPVDCQGHKVSVIAREMLESGVHHPSCLHLGSSPVPEQ